MTEKERELFLSAIVALLLLTAIVLFVAPNHGMAAPAAVGGGAEAEPPAVKLVVLTPTPEPSPEPTPAPTAEPQDYILNNNTKRFHYPDCKSVLDIYPQNIEPVTASRDELIARGYTPCRNCKP